MRTVQFTSYLNADDEQIPVEVEAKLSDYHPGRWTLANGDPGYPPDGGQVKRLLVMGPHGYIESILNSDRERLEEEAKQYAMEG